MSDLDVIVAGAGPAGRALVRSCALRGLRVALVDPQPDAVWTQTFGAWADELPARMPPDTIAASMPDITAWARSEHRLGRTYRILDTRRLQERLSHPGPAVEVAASVSGAVIHMGRVEVTTDDGGVLSAPLAIDATGSARALLGAAAPPDGPSATSTAGRLATTAGTREKAAVQTAHGVVIDEPEGFTPAFMDWRSDHGEDPEQAGPTFLYAVRLAGGKVLLEETALARRPALPLDVLRRRLHARLQARGIDVPAAARTEDVWIRVDLPVSVGTGGIIPFGAAAPLIHPATGFSVAAALRTAPRLAAAMADLSPDSTADAPARVRAALWPPGARSAHLLRSRGLEAVLGMSARQVVDFFERFFSLPADRQRAYLSGREDVMGVSAAMLAVFGRADGPLRRHLVRSTMSLARP